MPTFNGTSGDDPSDSSAPAPSRLTQSMEHDETNVIRLDPRDLNSIIQVVKADAPSSSQQTSAAYSFKREGFGRQYEFNSSLVRKLSNLHRTEDIETVIPEVIQELNVRNETLKIADSHPQRIHGINQKERGRRQEKETVHAPNALSEAGNSMATCFLQPSFANRLFQLE
ncbi:unnamed protein product [Heligmosomoides polygyrus]|uniref:Uncharacterized protein n=1 Tax=Heligmosomoides polygyrus TaxID=6339 RepID=A0A183FCE0_HELPZ|nr:unnamed protein product [Heligmosomoides polygyrus]